jgi:hypothetical protein
MPPFWRDAPCSAALMLKDQSNTAAISPLSRIVFAKLALYTEDVPYASSVKGKPVERR